MAIEGVKNYVAASAFQTTVANNTKVETSEETDTKLQSDKSSVNQPVEISKTDDTEDGKNKDGSSQNQNSSKQFDENEIRQKLKEINKKINNNTIAEFGMHEGTNRIMIKLKDKDTDEVIKEYPAEKTLDLIQKAWELAGILVDERR